MGHYKHMVVVYCCQEAWPYTMKQTQSIFQLPGFNGDQDT